MNGNITCTTKYLIDNNSSNFCGAEQKISPRTTLATILDCLKDKETDICAYDYHSVSKNLMAGILSFRNFRGKRILPRMCTM